MNASALRARRLRALDVEPLRRVSRVAAPSAPAPEVSLQPASPEAPPAPTMAAQSEPAPPAVAAPARVDAPAGIRRLALHPDQAELADPAIRKMYAALTEAVGKAGLQRVRVCDVADDASAAVMVFGAAPLPEGVPLLRVLRADPLSVLHADHERKRRLWDQLQALGRGGSG